MAGSLLGPDQVKKLNGLFPALVAHVRELLNKDHSAFGLMKVHCMVESFDTDEMARIFRELSFISPKEKLALVRAAIYELMASEPALFVSPATAAITVAPEASRHSAPAEVPFVPGFKLNINKTEAFHGQRPADTPPPAPITIHTPKAAEMLKAGDVQQREHAIAVTEASKEAVVRDQAKYDAAIAKLRAAAEPEVAPVGQHLDLVIVDEAAEVETNDESTSDFIGD